MTQMHDAKLRFPVVRKMPLVEKTSAPPSRPAARTPSCSELSVLCAFGLQWQNDAGMGLGARPVVLHPRAAFATPMLGALGANGASTGVRLRRGWVVAGSVISAVLLGLEC